jgi:hypothetical protein
MRIGIPALALFLLTLAIWPTGQSKQDSSQSQAAQEKSAQGTKEAPDAKKPAADVKKPAVMLVPTAKAFLESLNDKQRAQAKLEFDSEKRVQWHFIPMETRKGLPLMEMEANQKELALKLLQASVSNMGYNKATKIMSLESVLRKLEGPTSHERRNPEKYYFTLFGDVGPGKRWGLSVEGHHLSLNFVMQGNKIIDSTPQFFATNPAELKDDYGPGFKKGLQVLREEEQLGFEMLASLDDAQRKQAMLPGDVPSEIRGAGEPQPPTGESVGVRAATMTAEQKDKLKALMTAYTAKMRPGVTKERWELIENAGFDKIAFGWSGGDRAGVGHYYRVQGPTFVIEFINVQPDAAGNPANHIHCVWRDMQGDFDLPVAAK